jgi:hypothetical protein
MKNKFLYRILFILLVLFFGLQFLSHFSSYIAQIKPTADKEKLLRYSRIFFPLETNVTFQYGFLLLQKSQESKNSNTALQLLNQSIKYLRQAAKNNMLSYNSHLYLGKAYILNAYHDPTILDTALLSLKRAAYIKGNMAQVGLDTTYVMISLWPFLEETDKTFCKNLFKKIIHKISKNEFTKLLDAWGYYSQEIDFFTDSLQNKPEYYLYVAQKLSQIESNLTIRHQYLAKYESFFLEVTKKSYKEYLSQNPDDLEEKLKNLSRKLKIKIIGFYELPTSESTIDGKLKNNYLTFMKRLNLHILTLALAGKEWQKSSKKRLQTDAIIHSYILNLPSSEDLEEFNSFLAKYHYFDSNNIRSLLLKYSIQYQSNQYSILINEIETLKKEITLIKKGNKRDYVNLLLLLADAYISSGLLTTSMPTLKEIESISPGLRENLWRILKVNQILEKKNEILEQYPETVNTIKNSHLFQLNSQFTKRDVFFLSPRDKALRIEFSDSFKPISKSLHLLQIFLDEKIHYETYLNKLKLPLIISISGDNPLKTQYQVTIKIQ